MVKKPTCEELEQRIKELEEEVIKHTQTEKDWNIFFESSIDLLCLIGFDKKFKQVNPSWHKTLGWSEEELIDKFYTDFVHPDDLELAVTTGKERKERGESIAGFQNRYQCKDGSYRWLSWSAMPLVDQQLTFAIARDITDDKQVEETLQEKIQQLHAILSHAPLVLSAVNIEGEFILSEGKGLEVLGRKPGQFVGVSAFDLYKKSNPDIVEYIRRALSGESVNAIVGLAGKFFDVAYEPIRDHTGKIVGVVGVSNIITERKRVEESLQESKELFGNFIDSATDGFILFDSGLNHLEINESALKITGQDKNDVIGKNLSDIVPNIVESGRFDKYMEVIRTGESLIIEDLIPHPKFGVKHAILKVFKAGKGLGIIIDDITERKRIEEELRNSEEKYRSLINDVIDNSNVGFFILDSEFKVIWINRAMESYFCLKKEDVIGKNKRRLIREQIKYLFRDPAAFSSKVLATYEDNTYVENFECKVLAERERQERWLEHWSWPIRSGPFRGGRVEIYYDITDRKQAEETLRESEERFRGLFDAINNGVAVYKAQNNGEDFIFVDFNRAGEKIDGVEKDALIGNSLLKIFPSVKDFGLF
ncbi:PAS domain S-box protein, partial [Thermodesulfobacteriota bacterium]